MKTDKQLQVDVIEELRWDPSVSDEEIGVAAKDGVVTLSGSVDSYAKKAAAERAAERVSGAKAVAQELKVKVPGAWERTDTDIAHSATLNLRWHAEVPAEKIKIDVENGWLTLQGSVDWNYQKAAAESAVRTLIGVRGVINEIKIAPRVSAGSVRDKIEAALKRSAELDATKVQVEAADHKVTLSGTVRSWVERQDAERAAWNAKGVSQVDNRLTISV